LSASATILAILVFMLAGSLVVLGLLGRQIIRRRQEEDFQKWMSRRNARVIKRPWRDGPVTNLAPLSEFHPRPKKVIEGPTWTVAELSTDPPVEAKGKPPRWRLLAWRMDPARADWPPTGLRPAAHVVSFLDLFGLSSFPSVTESDRFMVFGGDPNAAKRLARSIADQIVPPDVGLLVHGKTLFLDFSSRPMEADELERMVGLAEQLAGSLARPTV
jgi:hypothetical protein